MTDVMSESEYMRHTLLDRLCKEGPQPVAERFVMVMFDDVNILQWCRMTSVEFTKYFDPNVKSYFYEFTFRDRPDQPADDEEPIDEREL